jgi:NitT/TauT family transport system substrate-binding protein
MVAYLRAVRMYNDAFVKKDPTARQKVVAAAVKYSTVKDPALYDKMQLQGLYPNGDLNVDSIKEQQEYFLSTGTQQERVALDNFIDTHFAQDAVTQLALLWRHIGWGERPQRAAERVGSGTRA